MMHETSSDTANLAENLVEEFPTRESVAAGQRPTSKKTKNYTALETRSDAAEGSISSLNQVSTTSAESPQRTSASFHNDAFSGRTQLDFDRSGKAGDAFSPIHYAADIYKDPIGFVKQLEGLGRIVLMYSAFSIVVTIALLLDIHYGTPQVPPSGAAATDLINCSHIGVTMLKKGGSSVDAIVASMFCVETVNIQSSGLGGGGFILLYNHKSGKSEVIDFRESAPANFTVDMMKSEPGKPNAKVIGIPGLLKGFYEAHSRFGKLSWSELLQPSIDLAENGFPLSDLTAHEANERQDKPMNAELKDFLYSNGVLRKAGDIVKRPKLAQTLRQIAYYGADVFYNQELGKNLIQDIQDAGGIMTIDDLKNYSVIWRDAVEASLAHFKVITTPPPTSGPALLMALRLFEKFNMSDFSQGKTWHYLAETLKFSFAQRARLGDPDFDDSKIISGAVEQMLSKNTIDHIHMLIKPNGVLDTSDYLSPYSVETGNSKQGKPTTNDAPSIGVTQPDDHGTSGAAFIDDNELYASVITSLNNKFGSGIVSKSTGLLLNDVLLDFADTPGPGQANLPAPGKRPLSSMSPVIIYDPVQSCHIRGSLAAANGTRILSGLLSVLIRIAFHHEKLENAIEAPRLHTQTPDSTVYLERFDNMQNIVDYLEQCGQKVTVVDKNMGTVLGVLKWNSTVDAHSDSRRFSKAEVFEGV